MNPFASLLLSIISLYNMVLFAWVIVSMLIYFNILNRYQPLVQKINYILHRLVDPVLNPIRKYIPTIGGIDLSPVVLILGLQFISNAIRYYA
jgi:YggT family protein